VLRHHLEQKRADGDRGGRGLRRVATVRRADAAGWRLVLHADAPRPAQRTPEEGSRRAKRWRTDRTADAFEGRCRARASAPPQGCATTRTASIAAPTPRRTGTRSARTSRGADERRRAGGSEGRCLLAGAPHDSCPAVLPAAKALPFAPLHLVALW